MSRSNERAPIRAIGGAQGTHDVSEGHLGLQVDLGRQTTQVGAGYARPRGPVKLLASRAQEDDSEPLLGEARGVGPGHVGEDAEHPDDGSRVD